MSKFGCFIGGVAIGVIGTVLTASIIGSTLPPSSSPSYAEADEDTAGRDAQTGEKTVQPQTEQSSSDADATAAAAPAG